MTTQEAIKACVNKQLEPYGVTYDDVKKGGTCESISVYENAPNNYFNLFGLIKRKVVKTIPWYQYYTFNSEQEFNEWKNFCIDLFRKELKMSKRVAEEEFSWFNLSYGLKQNYEVKI